MLPEHRARLLKILARLDQLEFRAAEITAEPNPDLGALAEELRELAADIRACAKKHLGDSRAH
jgi:hypothetical protein